LGYVCELLAINHWDVAIATHSLNHEKVRHLCQNLDKVDPLELVPGGRLDILVASPECTHHSNARGGKPRSDQKRADAWLLMRWLEKLYVKNLLIENVKEFMSWGPLGANGQPLKSKRGLYFKQFIDTLKINYNVEYKTINCADFGDPTTRERFFLMARRHSHPHFAWPAPTHASPAELLKRKQNPDFFGEKLPNLKPWRTARQDVIDWSIESRSIFDRKKPLSPNTMARIFAGLRKHSGLAIVMSTSGRDGHMNPRSADQPVRTVMPNSRLNLFEAKVEPFVMNLGHTKSKSDHTYSTERPLPTVTGLQEHAVVEASVESLDPFVVNMKGKSKSRSIDEPTVAQTTKPHQYLCESQVLEPVLVNHKGKDGRSRAVDQPSFTQCGGNHQSLVEGEITSFLVGAGGPTGQSQPRSVDEPARTVMPDSHQGLVEGNAFLLPNEGIYRGNAPRSLDEPTPTITQRGGGGLVENSAFIIHSGGPDVDARSVDEPTRTLLGREHQGLVETALQPFIITNNHGTDGGRSRTHDIEKPMPAVTTIDAWSVIEPYLIQFFGERTGQEPRTRSVDDPAWTVTGQGRMALVEPHIVAYHGNHKGRKDGAKRSRSVCEPLPAQDTSNRFGIVEGKVVAGDSFLLKSYTGSHSATLDKPAPTVTVFEHLGLVENDIVKGDPSLVKFYGTAKDGQSIDSPLAAVTGKDRFALVEPTLVRIKGDGTKKDVVGLYIPSLGIIVDIRFRMLQPPELAAAMSFPKKYKFAGNREDKVMQIGNAVPCKTAQALCKALLTEPARMKKPRAKKMEKAA
jgi:DNA (cytosine-5)-methyltransferase 1